MRDRYSQMDRRLLKKYAAEMELETRQDRKLILAQGVIALTLLDSLIPKKRPMFVAGRRCRVHELLVTWGELGRRCHWQSSLTALRSVLANSAPFYAVLPWAPEGHFQGVRILRVDHAGRGVVRDQWDAKDKVASSRRLLHKAMGFRDIYEMDPTDSAEVARMEPIVDRLLAKVELGSQEGPGGCRGCAEDKEIVRGRCDQCGYTTVFPLVDSDSLLRMDDVNALVKLGFGSSKSGE